MPASLIKLVITADTTTTVSTQPTVTRYFYNFDPADVTDGVLTIPAGSFVDDNGDPVVGNLIVAEPGNGYYQLYINGALQQGDLYTVSPTEVVVQDADNIVDGTPITLVVTNFDPDATSTTTVKT